MSVAPDWHSAFISSGMLISFLSAHSGMCTCRRCAIRSSLKTQCGLRKLRRSFSKMTSVQRHYQRQHRTEREPDAFLEVRQRMQRKPDDARTMGPDQLPDWIGNTFV